MYKEYTHVYKSLPHAKNMELAKFENVYLGLFI